MKSKLYMDGTKLNRHLAEVVSWLRGEWFAPIHMEISLTNKCNQQCSFCYINWQQGRIDMPEKMAIDLIRDAKRAGVKSALIAGEGEPTINNVYVKMIQIAGEIGLDMALNTNAIMLSEDDSEKVLPHLSWMRCSMQAANRELYKQLHGCADSHFDRAVDNIRKAVEIKRKNNLQVTIGIQQVFLKENAYDVANLATLSRDIGVDYFVVKPFHQHEHNREHEKTKNLVEQYNDVLDQTQSLSTDTFKSIVRWNFLKEAECKREYNLCLGLPFIIQIGADGKVFTCYPMADREEHVYGTLAENSIEEILKSTRYNDVWRWAVDHVNVSKCMPTCRQHNANKYLWWLTREVPDHLNFI